MAKFLSVTSTRLTSAKDNGEGFHLGPYTLMLTGYSIGKGADDRRLMASNGLPSGYTDQ